MASFSSKIREREILTYHKSSYDNILLMGDFNMTTLNLN